METSSTLPLTTYTTLTLAIAALHLATLPACLLLPTTQKKWAGIISTFTAGIGMVLSWYVFLGIWGQPPHTAQATWFQLGGHLSGIKLEIGLLLNSEAAIMLAIVNTVALLVVLFSTAYMKGDPGIRKYFGFLGLFVFSMLGIVLADNLALIFVFWELVGLSSYLLIGYWYQKNSATQASKKAFLMNRVGDLGFLIALMTLWSQFGTLGLESLSTQMQSAQLVNGDWVTASGHQMPAHWLIIAGIGLFCGAVGKSAQFPLQTWLPDAMEGPTPVSALIHAATMVAAGVYMLARVYVLLSPSVMEVIAVTGAITAFMGAVAALNQHDIKKVLAYSTVSQLGYMVMGIGVGAYDAALFHLMTHAAFKACLFLGAGAVIYTMHDIEHRMEAAGQEGHFDAQDMRFMGGLRHRIPLVFATYLVATLALAGLPLFSGFLSKDALLAGAWAWASHGQAWQWLVPLLGFVAAILTAYYMGRQLLLVFFGDFRLLKRYPELASLVQPGTFKTPWVMGVPLIILATLSLGLVYSLNPFDAYSSWFTAVIASPLPSAATQNHSHHLLVALLSVSVALAGGIGAYLRFAPGKSYASAYLDCPQAKGWFEKLSFHNWYLNEIYDKAWIRPTMAIAHLLKSVEHHVVDRLVNISGIFTVAMAHLTRWFDQFVVDGLANMSAYAIGRAGKTTRAIQSGQVQRHFIWALLGLLLLAYFFLL